MDLHIFPCADTLLYMPVYLALDALRENPKHELLEKRVDGNNDRVWKYKEFSIVLHEQSGGDSAAIAKLGEFQANNGDVSCVAIADPLLALQVDGSEGLRIVATFINRIALSSVFKEPRWKRTKPWWGHLERLNGEIQKRGRLLGNEFQSYSNHLSVAFCEEGETNKCLLRHFLGINQSAAQVSGFGPAEFEVVINDKSHVSFTAAPWLKEASEELFNLGRGDKLRTENWLPSIPYPFSSIITTGESWQIERKHNWKGPIGILIRHMLIAMALMARYRDQVAIALHGSAVDFRNFGLPKECKTSSYQVILGAVRHLVERDYLAEDLSNAWVAWDFAAEATAQKPIDRLSWAGIYTRYLKAVEREKEEGFWRTVADDEQFWKNEFRACMRSYMRTDKLTEGNRWEVPLYQI